MVMAQLLSREYSGTFILRMLPATDPYDTRAAKALFFSRGEVVVRFAGEADTLRQRIQNFDIDFAYSQNSIGILQYAPWDKNLEPSETLLLSSWLSFLIFEKHSRIFDDALC